MNRFITFMAALIIIAAMGCSNESGNPTIPSDLPDTQISGTSCPASQTHLWSYYDVYIDIETQSVESVLNRQAMFTANVTNFVNKPPTNLAFTINETPPGPDYIDVDIDVSITHPFPGLNMYDGYDVRGVFFGDGSDNLMYDSSLDYPVFSTDQFMLDDPDDGDGGGPDGYTRWFNAPEFPVKGLFGYTEGAFASKGYSPTATVAPYKYFADGLDAADSLWEFLTNTADSGVFTAGSTNTRNYYLRFPNAVGVRYGYAVIANWIDEETHPANAIETQALSVSITPDIYYVDAGDNGGDLDLTFDSFEWSVDPSTFIIESSVLSSTHTFDPATIAVGGGTNYSTYHVEIPADNVTQNTIGMEWAEDYWIIAEFTEYNYTSEYTPSGSAPNAPLAAFFRYDLFVSDEPYNQDPVCDVTMVTEITFPFEGWPVQIEFDASGSYDPDPGDVLSYAWDFDGDGTFGDEYDSGDDVNPVKIFDFSFTGDVGLQVTDNNGGDSVCYVEGFDMTIHPSKNIDVTNGTVIATDVAIDPTNGDALVYYPGNGNVRRYTRSSYYTSYNTYNCLSHTNAQWIDATFTGYFELAYYSGSIMRMYYYNTSGVQVYSHGHSFTTLDGILDITGFPNAGNWDGALGSYMTTDQYWSYGYSIGNVRYSTSSPGTSFGSGLYPGGGGNSLERINGLNVVGGEVDAGGNHIWWCEKNDCTVIKIPADSWYTWTGTYFGTYNTPGDDDSHLNEPHDLTRDDVNTFYVLDELSTGDYVIKGFTVSGTTTTAIDSFGDTDDWGYTPVRIEGSDYEGNLVVLQNDSTDSYLSVFQEWETP